MSDAMREVKVLDQDDNVVVIYKPKKSKKTKNKKELKKKSSSVSPAPQDDQQASSISEHVGNKKKRREHKQKGEVAVTFHTDPELGIVSNHSDAQVRESESEAFRVALSEVRDSEQASTFDSASRQNVFRSEQVLEQRLTSAQGDTPSGNSTQKSSFCYRMNHRVRFFLKEMMRFRALKIAQLLLSIYIAILSFADMGPPGGLRDTETGYFFDQESPERTEKGLILVNGTERGIVAVSPFQVACLGLARLSAWFMYPALVFVFISKFRATTSFLSKSPLAMYMYTDSHELHVYCGWTIVICSTVHTVFHISRWAVQGNLYLLLEHFSGLSGLFIIISCVLICIPMTIFREQISYEIRKNLHYLFIVFAGALVFHTPTSAIPNGGFTAYVFSILLVWYFLDATYCYFFMTEKIDTTKFSVLPSGVRMTMNVSKRFQKMGSQGGICYVCLPWLDRNQWHAFSMFENPSNPAERQIFIQKTGDWTTKLHQYLQRETVRPAWVHGPFPSPYDNADAYDNQILVATGIGITPALSVIRAHKDSRRINLIWAVRDQHLLEFFLRHLYLDHQGWNLIFYTGKSKLKMPNLDVLTNTNVCIIEGRPKLDELIPNIIYGVESGLGLPENYTPDTKAVASEMLMDRFTELKSSRALTRVNDAADDLACYASELGFQLKPSQSYNLFMSGSFAERTRRASSEDIMDQLGMGFRPWDNHDEAKNYVKSLDSNMVLPTWGMLYCGGAQVVLSELEKLSDKYEIGLHVESFAW